MISCFRTKTFDVLNCSCTSLRQFKWVQLYTLFHLVKIHIRSFASLDRSVFADGSKYILSEWDLRSLYNERYLVKCDLLFWCQIELNIWNKLSRLCCNLQSICSSSIFPPLTLFLSFSMFVSCVTRTHHDHWSFAPTKKKKSFLSLVALFLAALRELF